MRILVTGATGFVGRHLVSELLRRGHHVVAVSRDLERARQEPWFKDVTFVPCDIAEAAAAVDSIMSKSQGLDAIAHLAWPGLPNYKNTSHFENNFPESYSFLKALVASGIRRVLVTGTCFEYGMKNGCMREDATTDPENPYGLAKDFLRKCLQQLQQHSTFDLIWARLFYMYGAGQNSKSLLEQLRIAVERGDSEFAMSGGEQLRDFSRIESITQDLSTLLEIGGNIGVVNVCSGRPISVRKLVENWLTSIGASVQLNLGQYPYPDYEPLAFWGDNSKLQNLIQSQTNNA